MNCKATEKLLALHAGGDLPTRQARRVSSHLDSCGECRRLAAEFRVGVADSRASSAPEFDPNFFAELRSEVLTRIAREPQTRFVAFADRFVPRRTNYAYGLAVVFVLCLSASYLHFVQLHRRQASEHVNVSAVETRKSKTTARISGVESPSGSTASHDPQSAATPEPDEKRGATRKALRHARSARGSTVGGNEIHATRRTIESDSSAAEGLIATRTGNEVSTSERIASERETGSDDAEPAPAAGAEAAVTGAETLRIEIQTSDPTLRIIWLSPKTQYAPPAKTDAQGS